MHIVYKNENINIKYDFNKDKKIHGIYESHGVYTYKKNNNMRIKYRLISKFKNDILINYYYKDLFKIKRITPKCSIKINLTISRIIFNRYNENGIINEIIVIESKLIEDFSENECISMIEDINKGNIDKYRKFYDFNSKVIYLVKAKMFHIKNYYDIIIKFY